MTDLEDYPITTEQSEEYLNQRQLLDYREERTECLSWLLARGKTPEKGQGYAPGTIKPRAYRMDRFYRWVWDQEGGYTLNVTTDHADAWMEHLAQTDYSNVHKTNCQKSIQMLYKWRDHEHGAAAWEPAFRFSEDSSSNPRDFLTREERTLIREAALEYGSVPSYSNLSAPERDRWEAYLAQRFEKPKSALTPEDWERENGWKTPSLVSTSLDAGLRPIEVDRATPQWVDTQNSVLRIPKEESSKSRDNWIVGITDATADMLDRWLEERETRERYDGTDNLWLTRKGNPYGSSSLKYLLERLCEIADIDTDNRQMSWYAIRHSVGTYMTREEDLAAAQAQLRHKSPETTMKYDQTPVEDRRNALDRI